MTQELTGEQIATTLHYRIQEERVCYIKIKHNIYVKLETREAILLAKQLKKATIEVLPNTIFIETYE